MLKLITWKNYKYHTKIYTEKAAHDRNYSSVPRNLKTTAVRKSPENTTNTSRIKRPVCQQLTLIQFAKKTLKSHLITNNTLSNCRSASFVSTSRWKVLYYVCVRLCTNNVVLKSEGHFLVSLSMQELHYLSLKLLTVICINSLIYIFF